MKSTVLLLFCFFCGCAAQSTHHVSPPQTRSGNPFETFTASDVVKVMFGSDAVAQASPGLHPLRPIGVETTNRKRIAELYNAVATADLADEYVDEIAFAGIVSYQVFLDVQDNVLAVTHLVVHPSTMIVVSEGYMKNGTVYLGRPNTDDAFWMCGYSPTFSTLVISMMEGK